MSNYNGDKFLRRITVGVLVALILNIPVSIWWAAVINTKVDNLEQKMETLTTKVDTFIERVDSQMDDRYRGVDAIEDFKLRDKKIDILENKVGNLSIRVAKLEP
jgi:hypothetical protein